jgi:type I restriction enzyme S subunit
VTWPEVALGDVAYFVRGVTFKPEQVAPLDGNGTVACMRTKNVQGQLDLIDVWGIPRSLVKRGDQFLMAGDTLVSSANSWNLVGKCCWVPELKTPATFGGFVAVLRANEKRLEPRYLYRWFSSPRLQQMVRSFGRKTTSISNLDLARCLNLEIPLPPLDEQRRVARVLDAADALRAKRRASSRYLAEIETSLVETTFGERKGAPWHALEELLDFVTSGSRGWSRYYADNGALFLRIQNVRRNQLVLDDVAFVNPPATKEAERTRVGAGDVLLSITADLGRTAVVPEGLGPTFINQHLAVLRTRALHPDFLSAGLQSANGQAQLLRRNRQGVKAGLNFDDIRSVELPCPPRDEQEAFAARMGAIRGARGRASRHLSHLDALFASLQHRAFTGAL